MPRPRSLHPPRNPIWPLLLAGVLAGCGETVLGKDGSAACLGPGCPDAAETDGGVSPTGRRGLPGEELDGASDLSSDRAPSPLDLAPPDTRLPIDAPADTGVPDVSVMVPPDTAPFIEPDTAPPPVPPDAAPDMAVVVSPPDVAPPDMMPPPPDMMPPPPDMMPPPPDMMPPPPDVMPDMMPASNGCPSGSGPTMVRADLATSPFCIDSSEVTNAQYTAFLNATGNQTGGQSAACSWNSTFVPGTEGAPWPYAPGKDNRPVVNVDWCDARAYCKWAGKRLCGKIGGGSLTGWMAGVDPPTSQWANACTRSWQRVYPYGDTYKSTHCNLSAPGEGAQYLADVKSYPMCEGGYSGIFDMSGNVEEWIDACDKNLGASDGCASAGTSAWLDGLTPAEVTCADSLYSTARSTKWVMLGFRCCADQ